MRRSILFSSRIAKLLPARHARVTPSSNASSFCSLLTVQTMRISLMVLASLSNTIFHPGDRQITNAAGSRESRGRWRSSKPPLLDLDHNNCFLSPQGHKSTMHMIFPPSLSPVRSGPVTPVLFPCVRWDTSAPTSTVPTTLPEMLAANRHYHTDRASDKYYTTLLVFSIVF